MMPLLGRGYAVGKRLLNTHPKLKSQEIYIEPEPIEPIEIHLCRLMVQERSYRAN